MAQARARSSRDDRVRAALWFADRGFGIFSVWSTDDAGTCRCPKGQDCTSPGKHPISPNGFKDATTDPERIRTFLSAGSDPNYGMLCPDGVFALDVDGEDVDRLKDLQARYGELPRTLRTNTANGFHLFYYWPDGFPRPLHKMFDMVTRWGSGKLSGYVIGPRSIHASGVEYTPGDEFGIAALPAEWAAASQAPEQVIVVKGDELPTLGHRHDWLRDKARYYRGFLDDPAVLRAAVLAENAKLDEPKTEEEVDRAIGEVFERFPADPPQERQERAQAALETSSLGFLPAELQEPFPVDPAAVAYHGPLGECVFQLAEGTDAPLVGLLGSVLAYAGAMIPGMAYFHRMQTSSPFVALVGESSIGRKGTAMTRVGDAFAQAFGIEQFGRTVMDGVASGEGLVSAMASRQSLFASEPTVGMLVEEEYASMLAARDREGSTLDPKMRAAFDGSVLSNRRSDSVKTVLPPYWLAALIAITPDELRNRIGPGSMSNGSANRWLYLPVVKRTGYTATNTPPAFDDDLVEKLKMARRAALAYKQPLTVEQAAVDRLTQYSDWLPTVAVGLGHDLVRRLGVIAFRIGLIHALSEQQRMVTLDHLERGIALTEYAREGLSWVFGMTIGDKYADLLYRTLRAEGRLSKRTITRELVRDPVRQQAAIDMLLRLGLAGLVVEHNGEARRPTTWLVSSNS